MKIRLQADADIDPDIVRGARRREGQIDFQVALHRIKDGTPDPLVLQLAGEDDRVLVSGDLTMLSHFVKLTRETRSPGLIVIPAQTAIGNAVRRIVYIIARKENQMLHLLIQTSDPAEKIHLEEKSPYRK